MEKGLFFNAFPNDEYETGYDRNYSADDISNWLKAVITTGVIKTDSVAGTGEAQGLKVLADSGLNIKVNVGLAVIDGKPYINNSSLSLTLATAPTSGTRYDCVILRMDNTQVVNARKTYCFILSLDHTPTEADLTRNNNIYDLVLGYVAVGANVTSISQTNITDTRGNETLCPWTTAIKGYEDYYDAIVQRFENDITIGASTNIVVTDLAVSLYNTKYSLVSVYCNGLREDEEDYTIDTSSEYITIRFTANKSANAQISVILENFIDGEGLENVLEQYNDLVEEVANLQKVNEYNYYCNGNNDNIMLCALVNASIGAGKDIKVNVIGTFGISAPISGDGSSSNPYRIFNFTRQYNAKYTLDFSNCSAINYIPDSGKVTVVFSRGGGHIIGAKVNMENPATNTTIHGFSNDGQWLVENCEFNLSGYNLTYLTQCGTFNNCKATIKNAYRYSYVFYPKENSLIVVNGGEYKSYTQNNSYKSAIVGQTLSNSAIVLYGVNAPSVAVSGYYQTNSLYQTAGRLACYGLISALEVDSPSTTIYATLKTSLPDQSW